MHSAQLLDILRCPACGDAGRLSQYVGGIRDPSDRRGCPPGQVHRSQDRDLPLLHCTVCGQGYPLYAGYVDMQPRDVAFEHTSHYVSEEEAFAEALDYRSVGPPLLAAGVRQQVLQRMLRLGPADRVLDCGCGNAKFTLWSREAAGLIVGLDPASLFADAALEQVDLVQGDARRAPFASGSFEKSFSIDVFEHLTREDLDAVLNELHRLLCPGGRMLIYSNTREPSRLQPVVDFWRRLGRWLRRRGLVGPDLDIIRKADHVKAIATYEELVALVQGHGFHIVEVRFWNSAVTSFVEHVLMPLAEQWAGRKKAAVPQPGAEAAMPSPRTQWRARAARRGPLYWASQALTGLMGLDIVFFGRYRSGSYFLLLERD